MKNENDDNILIDLQIPLNRMIGWLSGNGKPSDAVNHICNCIGAIKRMRKIAEKDWTLNLSPAREITADITLMAGRISRRISSPNYGEMILLHQQCLDWTKGRFGSDEDSFFADFVGRFAKCMRLLATELEFLEENELSAVWPNRPSHLSLPKDDCYDPDKDCATDPEEATRKARSSALAKLEKRLENYGREAAVVKEMFLSAAAEFEADDVPEQRGRLDLRLAKHVIGENTRLRYTKYAMDEEPYLLLPEGQIDEETAFCNVQNDAAVAVESYLKTALKAARKLQSASAGEISNLLFALQARQCSFAGAIYETGANAELSDFFVRLGKADIQLLGDLAASKAAPIKPISVALDKSSVPVLKSAIHGKPAERDYFSDDNLRLLFNVSINTPSNWRRGKSAPKGFMEAFSNKDAKAMALCAERYKANRGKADAMNTKGLKRNISDEEMFKERAK